jgi:hypothetical protein
MLQRRNFLSLAAAAVPAAVVAPNVAFSQDEAPPAGGRGGGRGPNPDASLTYQRSGDDACLPDWKKIPTRMAAKTEVLYKTTHGKPNGLALTDNPNELWVLDQGTDHWVTLTNVADGSVIREFQADVVGPSGLVIDSDNVMWITSTHNSLIVAVDAATGKTIGKYVTPGAGRIYSKKGDPAARSSKLPNAYPAASRAVGGGETQARAGGRGGGRGGRGPALPPGQLAMDVEEGAGGTGAHGIVTKGDFLYYVCPPSRFMVVIDKKTWEVQHTWPTPGNRPHGTSWGDANKEYIWNVDSNENAFYKYNATTGVISEKVAVQEDPHTVCHGAKLFLEGPQKGYMYFCDDTGWMCRIKWT